MAERPEGSLPRPPRPVEAWPAPGDTERLPPAVDEAGQPAVVRPVEPGPAAVGPYPPRPALPPVTPLTPLPTPLPTPPGFGFRPQSEPSALLALVLAGLAWFACPILAAIAALMIAGGAKAKIEASGGALTGLGLVTAARWLAWIHIFLVTLGTIAAIIGLDVFGTLL